jgi:hypothetical protein
VISSPLGHLPNPTPNARHAPSPKCPQTITLYLVMRSRGKTQKRRGTCDNFKPLSTRPTRPLLFDPAVPHITASLFRKPSTAPHPPSHILLRLRSATRSHIHRCTHRRRDRCRRGQTPTAHHTDQSLLILSHRGPIRPWRHQVRRNTHKRA